MLCFSACQEIIVKEHLSSEYNFLAMLSPEMDVLEVRRIYVFVRRLSK